MAQASELVQQWKTLYSQTLPKLAKARDPAQKRWPVTLDHCFARIILDNTIGDGQQQWDKVLEKPAVKNMDEEQLGRAIALGEMIRNGKVDLEELDQISLKCRGKNEGKYGSKTTGKDEKNSTKRKAVEETASPPAKLQKRQSTLPFVSSASKQTKSNAAAEELSHDPVDFPATLKRIRSSTITPYRKRVYTILLSVPRGHWTTYLAMSDYLDSSARAVGNGMRHNPFAPDVPCHRVVASDKSIGGFYGSWGKDGEHIPKKLELLKGEGVRFDSRGKLVGEPFRKFHEFEDVVDKG